MMIWKWLPGLLYQTEDEGKRARQRRNRKRESALEAEHCMKRKMVSAIK
jgi:hypothetical protein